MILKKLNYYLWFLFFSIYWSSHNWGASRPENNATNLISLILLLNLSALLQVLLYFGYSLSSLLFVMFCGVPAFIIPYLLFQRKEVLNSKLKEFKFLEAKEYNRKRIICVGRILVFSIAFNAGIAMIRNITNSN